MVYFRKLFKFRESIIGKIIILFIVIFTFLLTPIVIQTYSSFKQARAYNEMVGNIVYANQLSNVVKTEIGPIVWRVVAGKVSFDNSEIMPLISDIRSRMNEIHQNTSSIENRVLMEVSLRALNTLEGYLNRLKDQIDNRGPVDDNIKLYDEIGVCTDGINDLLQEFSSKLLIEVDILNQQVSKRGNQNFIINISIALIALLVGLFAFWYISRVIMGPIEKLLSMSNKISEGDFSSRVELSASDEFNELAQSMNTMSEKIELLIEKSIEEEKQLQKLEYKAHQAQISPHFLYNTLDTIIWAAESKDVSKVTTLVSSLSSFFRISLSSGIDFITIADEVMHVSNYLAIQKIRYSDVLSYEIIVDEGLKDQKVLKLLLQPLVENALYHGIKNTRERGKITVSVVKYDNKVRFSVKDNGLGMTKEKLGSLRGSIISDSGSGSGGKNSYGLYNINRRLKLYYNHSEGVLIQSEYKVGTEVSFVLDIL